MIILLLGTSFENKSLSPKMNPMFKRIFLILFFVMTAAPSFSISHEQLANQGYELNQYLIAKDGLEDNAKLNNYLQSVYGRMLRSDSNLSSKAYRLQVIDSDEFNAFAIPPYYSYVNRGLLPYMNSEAQLVSILGHEIGHVEKEHSLQSAQGQEGSNLLVSLLRVLIYILSLVWGASPNDAGTLSDVGGSLASVTTALTQLHYSREHEFEADAYGVGILSRLGYKSSEALGAFGQLKRYIESKSGNESMSFFSTHPPSSERIDKINQLIQVNTSGDKVGQEEYLKAIDGVSLGKDPARGMIYGRRFVAAARGYAFEIPDFFDKWSISDQTLADFYAQSGEEEVLLLTQRPLGDLNLEKSGPKIFEWMTGKPFPEDPQIFRGDIFGTPSKKWQWASPQGFVVFELVQRGSDYFALIYFKSGSDEEAFASHLAQIKNSLESFGKIKLTRDYLKVIRLDQEMSVRDVAKKYSIQISKEKIRTLPAVLKIPDTAFKTQVSFDALAQEIALFNGWDEDTRLPDGTLVKIPWRVGVELKP